MIADLGWALLKLAHYVMRNTSGVGTHCNFEFVYDFVLHGVHSLASCVPTFILFLRSWQGDAILLVWIHLLVKCQCFIVFYHCFMSLLVIERQSFVLLWFHFMCLHYFFGDVACRNLPWQGHIPPTPTSHLMHTILQPEVTCLCYARNTYTKYAMALLCSAWLFLHEYVPP